ncbi:MAG: diaminopimelate epimerase [Lachnospiraceae bacterium]|nr:diaminopimelate epimerase [Lachnospiraceae bacterium]
MKFTKMHGCGNDYVYVNGFEQTYTPEEKKRLAIEVSRQHFGIGSDGLIFINPSEIADFEMEMYNADGSRGEMCGNGIRCVGKYVYDHGLTDQKQITVESFGAIKHLTLFEEQGRITGVRVDMGNPIFSAPKVPVDPRLSAADGSVSQKAEDLREQFPMLDADAVVGQKLTTDSGEYEMICVSMGNPHAVIFMDEIDDLDLETIGPGFENHPCFPNRTNTEFVKVIDREHVSMRVWERGSGETLACGTGCCATAVACILAGKTEDQVYVRVLGGELKIEWDREKNLIYMTGPATTVFEGDWSEE